MDTNPGGSLSRRRLLQLATLGLLTAPLASLSGCSKSEPQVRIASNVWPGYELLYLARELNYFHEPGVRLVEVPSATVCIQSLAAGTVDGAMLTLDEVLTARAEGLILKIITVLDVSLGADVLLARPDLADLQALRSKTIGVEQSAVGAVMLDAVLSAAGLMPAEVQARYLTVNKHREAYLKQEVDALVTFEPVKTQLLQQGARQLFSSADIPGRIIDVLAVLPSAIDSSPAALATLVTSHFRARDFFLTRAQEASQVLAKRLQLAAADVPSAFLGLQLPDVAENRKFLNPQNATLETSARELARIMKSAGLLPANVRADGLVDDRFLPNDA
jgi:NitT/TauT family transport system substrate-binding protein